MRIATTSSSCWGWPAVWPLPCGRAAEAGVVPLRTASQHPANILTTAGGKLLSMDTVAMAPPERDLWMLARTPEDDAAVAYTEATGRAADANALDFFRLTWISRISPST